MTKQKANQTGATWVLAPFFGGILFTMLYFTAATLYPGGSQANPSSNGFSWRHNYWCNLLNENAMNGEINPARPVAIIGMIVLCISLAIFWYQFARIIKFEKNWERIIQSSGIISMAAAVFIFSRYHDVIIPVSGILAIFAIAGTFLGLHKMGWTRLYRFGIFNLALMAINNFIYYTHHSIFLLPVVQKVTFLCVLTWISIIDIRLYQLTAQRQPIS